MDTETEGSSLLTLLFSSCVSTLLIRKLRQEGDTQWLCLHSRHSMHAIGYDAQLHMHGPCTSIAGGTLQFSLGFLLSCFSPHYVAQAEQERAKVPWCMFVTEPLFPGSLWEFCPTQSGREK